MIIGIGGISNAGKSQFARRLKSYLSPKKVSIICQDDYVYPTANIPKINDHTDWETPDSINFPWLHDVILNSIDCNDIVIMEGIFAFYNEVITDLLDYKIMLSIPKNIFLERKASDLRWGKEPQWYIEHIWESHLKYCSKDDDIIEIDVSTDYDLSVIPLTKSIKDLSLNL